MSREQAGEDADAAAADTAPRKCKRARDPSPSHPPPADVRRRSSPRRRPSAILRPWQPPSRAPDKLHEREAEGDGDVDSRRDEERVPTGRKVEEEEEEKGKYSL